MAKKKSISSKEEEQLTKELEQLQADEDAYYAERQQTFDYITEELCALSAQNYREFMRSVRLRRRANSARGRMSANA